VIAAPVVEGQDYTSNVQFGTSTSPAFIGQVPFIGKPQYQRRLQAMQA
jgi:hypothetical protein